MKTHTQTYKQNLIQMGKEINAKITYTINGVETELGGDNLGSVTPHYEADLLKSVMKQIDIVSDIDIPLNTEINVQFGLKYDSGNYEYIDYGNYIIYSSEKQEDTNNYKIIAYDKMLYAMKDYEQLFGTNLFDEKEITTDTYMISSGETGESSVTNISGYIKVEEGTYTLSYDYDTLANNNDRVYCFYNSEKEYVSGYSYTTSTKIREISVPSTASYIRFAYDKNCVDIIFKKGTQDTLIYPVTINQYIEKLCNKIGLEFANSNEIYANYDKEIPNELYSNLGYTYRDVLDDLAQVTASTICINKDDQLEIRYLNDSINESEQVEGTNFEITDNDSDVIKVNKLEGETTQETLSGKNLFRNSDTFEGNANAGWTVLGGIDPNNKKDNSLSVKTIGAWNGVGANLKQLYEQGKIAIGDTLTYSIYFKTNFVPTGNVPFSFTLYRALSSAISVANIPYANITPGTWYRISASFVVDSYSITATNSRIELNYYVNDDRYYFGDSRNNAVWFSQPQIEKSTTLTDYEKYTFGPTPNPNFPQHVDTKTGLQNIKLESINKVDLTPLTQDKVVSSNATTNEWVYDEELKREVYHIGRTTSSSTSYPQTTFKLPMERFDPTGKNWAVVYRYKFTTNKPGEWGGASWINFNGRNNWETVGINSASYVKDLRILENTNGWQIGACRISKNNTEYNNYPTTSYKYMSICLASSTATICDLYVSDIMVVEISDEEYNATTYTPPQLTNYVNEDHKINLGKNICTSANYYSTNGADFNIDPRNLKQTFTLSFIAPTTTSSVSIVPFAGSTNLGTVATFSMTSGERVEKTVTLTDDVYNKIQGGATCRMTIYKNNAGWDTTTTIEEPQIENNNSFTGYSPYFEPIELCKINDYKDEIRQSKGYNLFDNSLFETFTSSIKTIELELKPNTTYTMSSNIPMTSDSGNLFFKLPSGTYATGTNNVAPNISRTLTTGNDGLVNIGYRDYNGSLTDEANKYWYMLNEGDVALKYEPYSPKGTWFIEKQIGKVVLNGSEDWSTRSGGTTYAYQILNFFGSNNTKGLSNYWRFIQGGAGGSQANECIASATANGALSLFTNNSSLNTLSNLKTWLSTHNTEVYYVLATPTDTEITKDNYPELLSQLKALEKMKLLNGYTKITSDIPINFSYSTEYETINEDYIKNTRASFGEKYGPINSIVLSRAESDNIYIQDEDSIEQNGLCEIKIKDNQIMNDNNRDQFLPDLLYYLKGIEYYINDFESIGITYLDLCDKYHIQIGDTKYLCVMFNDEVGIKDGLNEIIYTNKPDENETDYKKADKTDQKIIKTNLEVDKQNQRITALVGDTENSFAQVQVEVDKISSEVQSTNVEIDNLGQEIDVVRNSITEQTSEAITDWFNSSLKTTIEDLENSVDSNDQSLNEIKSYVRRGIITDPTSPWYNQVYVELGDTTNQTTLRILPNRIQFLTNGQETAFISNNQLYINESTILTKEKIGNWVTTQDEDGLLNTYWED